MKNCKMFWVALGTNTLKCLNLQKFYLNMEDLKDLLDISDLKESDINKRFKKIAETLMGNYIIKKGEKKYAFTEIEFYLYTNSHQDYITYPRKTTVGNWWFHPSGVDITFGSSDIEISYDEKGKEIVSLYDNPQFGGILIRGLYNIPSHENKEGKYIFGPHNCINELWDKFNAFNYFPDEYPIIEKIDNKEDEDLVSNGKIIACKRHIKIEENKKQQKFEDWIQRLNLTQGKIKSPTKEYYLTHLFNDIDIYNYRFFNIIDGENTWDAIKHLTQTEKKNLKTKYVKD